MISLQILLLLFIVIYFVTYIYYVIRYIHFLVSSVATSFSVYHLREGEGKEGAGRKSRGRTGRCSTKRGAFSHYSAMVTAGDFTYIFTRDKIWIYGAHC